MKKRIDNLQAENQTLKTDLDRHRATVNKRILVKTIKNMRHFYLE